MTKEEKIRAVLTRDKSSDGKFIFGVKTTKIICRPGCPSRVPLEKTSYSLTQWMRRSKAATALVNGVNHIRKGKVNSYGKHCCII